MDGADAAHGRAEARRVPLTAYLPITGLFLGSFVVYLILSLRSPLPVMWPDEFRYAHLARSLADGNGFVWRNESLSQPAALYIYALTPLWAIFKSTVAAYHASKVLNCLALSAQVFPVYLLARPLLGRRLALVPAALTVAGTWMIVSAHIITEDLGIPLATTALCLLAMTLYRPSNRTGFLAIAFALLAAWARIQLAVLLPAIALSLTLDILVRQRGEERRERLDAHLFYLATAVGVSVVGLILVIAAPGVAGNYKDIFGDRPSVGRAFEKTALEMGGLVTASGFIPVLLMAAASMRPAAWRDSKAGPLLRVFWPAALATCVQAGLFLAGVGTHRALWWGIERYVVYALPICFVAVCVLARNRRLVDWRVLAGAAALGLLLLLHPGRVAVSEERAAWSMGYRLHQLIGTGTGVSLALAALLGVGIVAGVRKYRADRTLLALLGVTACIFAIQDQASWHFLTNVTRTFRNSVPADLQWVDQNSHGPVAVIDVTATDPTIDTLDFFNRNLVGAYGPPTGLKGRPMNGKTCSWVVDPDGTMRFQPGCSNPHAFFVNDPFARMTWQNETYSVTNPQVGRIARLGPGPEKLRSLLILPCPRTTPTFSLTSTKVIPSDAPINCAPGMAGEVWSQAPGRITVRYVGGNVARKASLNRKVWQIPPHRVTTVSFPVPRGVYRFTLSQNWQRNVGNPRIADVRLDSDGGTSVPLI
jgi:hypothetical protein